MFLNYLKGFSVKKIVKNSFLNVKSVFYSGAIKTVGLIIDESRFTNTEELVSEFIAHGIARENIEILLYKSKSNVGISYNLTKLESSHLNWKAQIKNKAVNDFIASEFDLLVSYYDVEKAILLVVTHESKAKFKVGFSIKDKRANNLMINTNLENYKIFVQELFRYLKILNKL